MRFHGIHVVILLAAATFLQGCASITTGKIQPLSVQATCDSKPLVGAHCKLTNSNGQWFIDTPGSVSIQKAFGDLALDCTKEGLTPTSGVFKSSSNGGVWGNIIAGGVIGYAIDASNGAGFDYPSMLTVTFQPPCDALPKAAAPGSASAAATP